MKILPTILLLILASSLLATEPDDYIVRCRPGEPFPWKFLGKTANVLNEKNPSFSFPHHCFLKTTVTWGGYSADGTEAIVMIDSQDPIDTFCTDAIIIHNMYNYEVRARIFKGKSTFKFKVNKQRERDMIEKHGLFIAPMCESWMKLLPDIFLTAASFMDTDPKDPTEASRRVIQNLSWQHKMTGRKISPRKDNTPLSLEWAKANIRSGDIYCDNWISGFELLIDMFIGSECEHSGIFMWGIGEDEGQLFMIESTRPVIKKEKIEDWFRVKKDHTVALNRLSEENSKKFNVEKAWEGINKNLGNPYGFEAFLFSFFDTAGDNMPQLFDFETFHMIFAFVAHVPEAKYFLDLLTTKGLNKRLGTTGLSYFEVLDTATKRGMTMGELWAVPEQKDWKYQTGANYSERYICSAFATYLLQQGGILPEEIAPQEFTPKDVYQLGIYEKVPPAACRTDDPNRPFCLLYGDYALDYSTYNSVKPYPHMNERCPSKGPDFYRPAGC